MRARKLLSATALTAAALLIGGVAAPPTVAQADEISSLRGQRPNLPDFGDIVANRSNLRILGKALFWDATVGSDGFACASCHFHAGADIRITNQFNPGGTADGPLAFDSVPDADDHAVNITAKFDQFPFFDLVDGVDTTSNSELRNPANVARDGDDRFSSNGTFNGDFVSGQSVEDPNGEPGEIGDDECDIPIGRIHENFRLDQGTEDEEDDLATRKVEPRHTPSVVNAVFNFRNFWDGRANNVFNGVDPFGERTNKAGIGGVFKLEGGEIDRVDVAIRHASLASQAVGPVLSDFEMSCAGRPFAFVGRKILAQRVLQNQQVASTDSVFRASGLIPASGPGLDAQYEDLVKAAFNPAYWDDDRLFQISRDYENEVFTRLDPGDTDFDPNRAFTLIEQNFPLFWGLALHEYQASLISDASDFDRGRLSASARRGQAVFEGKGKCIACHNGPLLSAAAITNADNNLLIEGMFLATETNNRFAALYDDAFYNIGVSPTEEDIGLGGRDPFNNSFSFTVQLIENDIVDEINLNPDENGNAIDAITFEEIEPGDAATLESLLLPITPQTRHAVEGAFKTPILRNVGTTPPYMHDGSMATLDQVIEFYNRGGNRLNLNNNDGNVNTTGNVPNGGFDNNLDADIGLLELTPEEKTDLKNFMLSLTDRRVLCHRAPFDHPELDIYLGHNNQVGDRPAPRAEDVEPVLPAVGSRGYPRNDCLPNTGDLFGEMQTKFNALMGFTPQ